MDDLLLMLVHPASEGDNEKGKWIQKRVALRQAIMRTPRFPPRNNFQSDRVFAHYAVNALAKRDDFGTPEHWGNRFEFRPGNRSK
jgi:hypothetical protein